MDVKTICLGVLSTTPATGYDIRKAFESGPFRHFCGAGFGSIYPALHKLESEGLIKASEHAANGRESRKVFEISRKGRKVLREKLADTGPIGIDVMRSEFLFRIFLSSLMDKKPLKRLLDERRTTYRKQLELIDDYPLNRQKNPGEWFVIELGRQLMLTALRHLEENAPRLLEGKD